MPLVFDGVNSFLSATAGFEIYQPSVFLRLATGALAGLTAGTIFAPVIRARSAVLVVPGLLAGAWYGLTALALAGVLAMLAAANSLALPRQVTLRRPAITWALAIPELAGLAFLRHLILP